MTHRRKTSMSRSGGRCSITKAFSKVQLGERDTLSSTQSQPVTQECNIIRQGMSIRSKLQRNISVDVTSDASQDFLW